MLAHLIYFGCRLNAYESIALSSGMEKSGFLITNNLKDADFVIINTCTVTNRADQKNRQIIRRVHRENPNTKIVVTGCYATTDAEEIKKLPGVYSVISNQKKAAIPYLIKNNTSTPKKLFDGQFGYPSQTQARYARAYLKIQDGCNKSCSYCKIPLARGSGRSRNFKETIAAMQELISLGFKEITITGVNIGWYKSSEGQSFNNLFESMLSLSGEFYIRISSIEPGDINQELARLLTHPKAALFLHVPLQSGSKEILKMMRRGYTPAHYKKRIEYVRQLCPDIHLGTDIIVGFPGETDHHFEETLNFCEEMKFANIHIFPYSKRNKTPIIKKINSSKHQKKQLSLENKKIISEVSGLIIKERIQRLKKLKTKMYTNYINQTSEKTFKAIIEKYESNQNQPNNNKALLINTVNLVTENYVKLILKSKLQSFAKGDMLNVSYDKTLAVRLST